MGQRWCGSRLARAVLGGDRHRGGGGQAAVNPSRAEALFRLALEKPAEKRAAFLDVMCEGNAALRARLEARLADTETKP